MKKRAAMELSVSTIVVVILAMAMLILGVILVRSIMCGAIGMTGEMNNKVSSEINKLFAGGHEVVCIGESDNVIPLSPNAQHIIWCSVKAPETAEYKFIITDVVVQGVSDATLQKWILTEGLTARIAPGKDSPQKVLRLNLPDNAPEKPIIVNIEIEKDGEFLDSKSLDFTIQRNSWFADSIC